MCTSYRTHYLICKREDLARGPNNNIPCVDEDFHTCRKAKESSQNCSEPVVSPLLINDKCSEHGGPSPQKKEKAMRKRELQDRERQERERQERERQEREMQIMALKEHQHGEWSNAGCWIM
jgi:recombinational DNA repair protein (RecF pathway)